MKQRENKPTVVIAKQDPQTEVDVRVLLEQIELLPDGRIIPHETLEQLLHMRRESSRYKTVTKHWRKIVFREQGVFLDGRWAYGRGFKALTPDEMIRWTHADVRHIGRRLRRALLVAATPRDEELHDPQVRLYRARLMSATEQISVAHRRVLTELNEALRPPRQLRRVVDAK